MRLEGTAPVIEDCVFEANTTHGLYYDFIGVSLDALDVVNCTFRDHPGDAVNLNILLFKSPLILRRDPFAIFSQCTFENNATGLDSDMPLAPVCRIEDSTFTGNDLATYGSVDIVNCDVVGGVNGFAGEIEGTPHHIAVDDCRISGLTGVVFDDAQEIRVTGCEITDNPGSIHTGGPQEEAYEILEFTDCEITGNGGDLHLGTPFVSQSTLSLVDCVYAANGGPVSYEHRGGFGSLTVTGSTVVGNDGGGILVIGAFGGAAVTNSIVAGNVGAGIRWNEPAATWTVTCSDVWNNTAGDYSGLPDQAGLAGNITADPLFCDPAAGDDTLRADSPCLPGATGCGLMGARGQGCALPTIWFVATWGSDGSGNGTAANPFHTVQFGLDTAAVGDTVAVDVGVYPEALEITRGVLLVAESADPAQCILSGVPDHRVVTIHSAPDTVRIRGFSIFGGQPTIGGYDGINPGGGVLVYGPPLVMESCRIAHNATPLAETGTGGGGIHARDGSYLRLVDCEVYDNLSFRAGGLLHRSSAPLEIHGSLVFDNHSERQAGGVWILPPEANGSTCVIAGSTIAHNTATLNGSGLEVYLSDLELHHSIVAFNSGGDCQARLTDCTGDLACNDLFDPGGGCVYDANPLIPRPSDIDADPWFCRKFPGDYRLLEGSPCAMGESSCGQIGAQGVGCLYTEAPPNLPATAQLHPPRPNPFNARVTLSFALARPGRARLEVVDLRGAAVTTLVFEELPRGEHEVTWAGTDTRGRQASAGVYLVRLVTDDGVLTTRVALVK